MLTHSISAPGTQPQRELIPTTYPAPLEVSVAHGAAWDAEYVLMADDNTDDAFFIEQAFAKAGSSNKLFFVRDGKEACEYLQGAGLYSHRATSPLPALLLLDLKMPRMNGFEVLAWLRTQPDFSHIPVVVLTGSPCPADHTAARILGAGDVFSKPCDSGELLHLVKNLHARWLGGKYCAEQIHGNPEQFHMRIAADKHG